MFAYKLSKNGCHSMYLGSLEECRAMGNMTLMCLYTKATRALADNRELSKLTPAKMFDAINK